jgi:hypothetical protein
VDLKGTVFSEYGFTVMSSFESMSATLSPENWGIQQPVWAQRNYPCDNFIHAFFGKDHSNVSAVGASALQRQTWQCMIAQAFAQKQYTEALRSMNTVMTQFWQYNEIWPTGGWGSIEYGTPTVKGQVVGGRWKPLQHFLRRSVFATVGAGLMADGRCYVRNDGKTAFTGSLRLTLTRLSTGVAAWTSTQPLSIARGAHTVQWVCVKDAADVFEPATFPPQLTSETQGVCESKSFEPGYDYKNGQQNHGNATSPADCCAKCTVYAGFPKGAKCTAWTYAAGTCWFKTNSNGRRKEHKNVTSGSFVAPTPAPTPIPSAGGFNCTSWEKILADANCTNATCVFTADVLGSDAAATAAPLSSNQQLLLPPGDLKVANAAVKAVVGATNADGLIPVTVSANATALLVTLTTLAHGVFSDNVFLLTQHAPVELLFTPYGPADVATLRASLRIAHLAQYL